MPCSLPDPHADTGKGMGGTLAFSLTLVLLPSGIDASWRSFNSHQGQQATLVLYSLGT